MVKSWAWSQKVLDSGSSSAALCCDPMGKISSHPWASICFSVKGATNELLLCRFVSGFQWAQEKRELRIRVPDVEVVATECLEWILPTALRPYKTLSDPDGCCSWGDQGGERRPWWGVMAALYPRLQLSARKLTSWRRWHIPSHLAMVVPTQDIFSFLTFYYGNFLTYSREKKIVS